MTVDAATTRLDASLVEEAGELQARAFFIDPVFEFVFPDAGERRRHLPWLMQIGVAYGVRFGEVHTTSGVRTGHAVWLPPGETQMAAERMTEVGFIDPESRLGAVAFSRFSSFMEHIEPTHLRLVPESHWYLMILGVDPPHQGKGVGSTLIRPMLARADAEGRRCYLETAKERNVTFYRSHGFEVGAEDDIPGGPHVWMMVREPRRKS